MDWSASDNILLTYVKTTLWLILHVLNILIEQSFTVFATNRVSMW